MVKLKDVLRQMVLLAYLLTYLLAFTKLAYLLFVFQVPNKGIWMAQPRTMPSGVDTCYNS